MTPEEIDLVCDVGVRVSCLLLALCIYYAGTDVLERVAIGLLVGVGTTCAILIAHALVPM